MNPKLRVVLAVSLLAVTGALIAWLNRGGVKEPVNDGKRYSQWLKQAFFSRQRPLKDQEIALAAMDAIGTNAVPYLFRELVAPESTLKAAMFRWVPKNVLSRFGVWPTPSPSRMATEGFKRLGNHALPFLQEAIDDVTADPKLRKTYVAAYLGIKIPVVCDGITYHQPPASIPPTPQSFE